MSAEPATLKTALAVAAVAALGPLAGEYALILLGGFFGSMLALQRMVEQVRWWAAVALVLSGTLAGTLFAGVAASILAHYLPDWVSVDMLWVPLAALIAMYWRDASDQVPRLLKSWRGKGTP